MSDVVIFGTGQIAELAMAYLEQDSDHRVVAFTLDAEYRDTDSFHGRPVVDWEDLDRTHPQEAVTLFCPISYKGVNAHRKDKYLAGKARGYDFISFVHPRAHYYNTPVGENTFIMESNVIQPFTSIGDNCILWSGNHIGHHTTIRSHAFIASHVVISGSVDVGERCFLGVNATVRDNVRLGEACVIGAGALVLKDLPDEAVLPGAGTEMIAKKSSELRRI